MFMAVRRRPCCTHTDHRIERRLPKFDFFAQSKTVSPLAAVSAHICPSLRPFLVFCDRVELARKPTALHRRSLCARAPSTIGVLVPPAAIQRVLYARRRLFVRWILFNTPLSLLSCRNSPSCHYKAQPLTYSAATNPHKQQSCPKQQPAVKARARPIQARRRRVSPVT